MKLKELLEAWKTAVKSRAGKYSEIFVNPSKKEIDSIRIPVPVPAGQPRFTSSKEPGEFIRFIASKGKVYVFPGDLMYDEAIKALGLNLGELGELIDNDLGGIAQKQNNKWVAFELHDLDEAFDIFKWDLKQGETEPESKNKLKSFLKVDFSYVNKYIDITEIMRKFKNKLRKYSGFEKI